jgi:hypothetical protein
MEEGHELVEHTAGVGRAALVSLLALSGALSFDSAVGFAQDRPASRRGERAERVEGLPIAAHAQVEHAVWDLLLKRHVASGLVNYEGFRRDRAALERYAASLQDVQPSQLGSHQAQLAFWINAYNANVVKGVLDHDPMASVKEVKGFFDRIRYRVAGRELTLNEVEGEGRALGDWRIHFAVVCASSSCPPLRAEAYAADQLDAQLAEQTRQFLDNPQRGLRIEDGTLWVSKIFDWYTIDFIPPKALGLFRGAPPRPLSLRGAVGVAPPASPVGRNPERAPRLRLAKPNVRGESKGRLTPDTLVSVLAPYLAPEVEAAIRQRTLVLRFMEYDWSLNAQRRSSAGSSPGRPAGAGDA